MKVMLCVTKKIQNKAREKERSDVALSEKAAWNKLCAILKMGLKKVKAAEVESGK